MDVLFLGTGGGRVNLVDQIRGTAGFRIEGAVSIHVDPGPNTLAQCARFGVDPKRTDILIVTHRHVDHCNDAAVMIEAMTEYTRKRGRGILIASEHTLRGEEKGISSYHQKLVGDVRVLGREPFELIVRHTPLRIIPTLTIHDEKSARGFVLETERVRIGYTSDTEYFEGVSIPFKNVDLLIINCLRPDRLAIPGHLDIEGARRIITEAHPRAAVLTHLGVEFSHSVMQKALDSFRSSFSFPITFAYDGYRVSVRS